MPEFDPRASALNHAGLTDRYAGDHGWGPVAAQMTHAIVCGLVYIGDQIKGAGERPSALQLVLPNAQAVMAWRAMDEPDVAEERELSPSELVRIRDLLERRLGAMGLMPTTRDAVAEAAIDVFGEVFASSDPPEWADVMRGFGVEVENMDALTLGLGVTYHGEPLDPAEVGLVYPKGQGPGSAIAKVLEALRERYDPGGTNTEFQQIVADLIAAARREDRDEHGRNRGEGFHTAGGEDCG